MPRPGQRRLSLSPPTTIDSRRTIELVGYRFYIDAVWLNGISTRSPCSLRSTKPAASHALRLGMAQASGSIALTKLCHYFYCDDHLGNGAFDCPRIAGQTQGWSAESCCECPVS